MGFRKIILPFLILPFFLMSSPSFADECEEKLQGGNCSQPEAEEWLRDLVLNQMCFKNRAEASGYESECREYSTYCLTSMQSTLGLYNQDCESLKEICQEIATKNFSSGTSRQKLYSDALFFCPRCGDGVVGQGEECDGDALCDSSCKRISSTTHPPRPGMDELNRLLQERPTGLPWVRE